MHLRSQSLANPSMHSCVNSIGLCGRRRMCVTLLSIFVPGLGRGTQPVCSMTAYMTTVPGHKSSTSWACCFLYAGFLLITVGTKAGLFNNLCRDLWMVKGPHSLSSQNKASLRALLATCAVLTHHMIRACISWSSPEGHSYPLGKMQLLHQHYISNTGRLVP